MEFILVFIIVFILVLLFTQWQKYQKSGGFEMQAINQAIGLSAIQPSRKCSQCDEEMDFVFTISVHLYKNYRLPKTGKVIAPYCKNHGMEIWDEQVSSNVTLSQTEIEAIQATSTHWSFQYFSGDKLSQPIDGVLKLTN